MFARPVFFVFFFYKQVEASQIQFQSEMSSSHNLTAALLVIKAHWVHIIIQLSDRKSKITQLNELCSPSINV